MEIASVAATTPVKPGKAAQSVGHMAKAAVAEARAAGIELSKNAQGKAASAIAQGADPASIFAAQAADTPEADAAPLDDGQPLVETAAPADDGQPLVETAIRTAKDGYSAATIALALLDE